MPCKELGVFTKDLYLNRSTGERRMLVLLFGGASKPCWELPQLRESVVILEGELTVDDEAFGAGAYLEGPASLAKAKAESCCVCLLTLSPIC